MYGGKARSHDTIDNGGLCVVCVEKRECNSSYNTTIEKGGGLNGVSILAEGSQ